MSFFEKYKYWILVSILLPIIVFFCPIETSSPFAILLMGLCLGIFIISLNEDQDQRFLLNLFIVAYISRILLAFSLYHVVYLYNGRGLLGDCWPYSDNGYHILKFWQDGIKDIGAIAATLAQTRLNQAGNLGNYDVWNAMVYSFTGKSPLSVIFINCTAMSLSVLIIYDIAKEMYDRKAAKFAAILTAFWPSVFFWSIQNLKEAISIFLISLLVWAVIKLARRFRFYLIFIMIIASLILKEFRGIALLVFMAAFLFSFLVPFLRSKKIETLFFTGFFIAAAIFCLNKFLLPYVSNILSENIGDSILEFIHQRRAWKAYGGSAFFVNVDLRNPLKFMFYLPVGLLVAFLAPFPWQMASMRQVVSIPEMVGYYFLLFYIFAGAKFVISNRIRGGAVMVTFIFGMMFMLALAEGNIGTLFRHRAMILPLIFILAAIGLAEKKRLKNA